MKTSLLARAAAFASLSLLFTPASAKLAQRIDSQGRDAIADIPLPFLTGESAITHLKETGQYESLASAMANATYGVRMAEASGQRAVAQNAANGMGSVFTPEGLSCTIASGGVTYTVQWQLKSLGFGIKQTPVPAGKLHTGGQRVELIREEMKMTEWFCNAPAGLEHGFTLAERPLPNSAGEPLSLVLAVGGDLRPQTDAAGQNLMLCDATGRTVLAYKKLKVWDAAGTELKAVMDVKNGNVILSVEESGARYPLTIDPTFEAYIKASNAGSGDRFGNSVSISGDTAVIGAIAEASLNAGNPNDNSQSGTGAVYVFVRNGGIWSQQAYLKATPLDANIAFGCSVAVSGDTLVAGAYGESRGATGVNGSASNAGAAYVFVRNGTTWSQQAKLKASNISAEDRFAESVAISGDTIVVGSQHEDSAATTINGNQADETAGDAGAAYVYVRSGTTWSQQAYLKASNTNANDRFGVSVGISGDTIVVGANNEASAATSVNGNQSDNTAPGAGAAYVFVRSGVTWSQQAYLKSSNNHLGYGFGNSVAISGDSVVAAARGENSAAGAAYVFARSGGIWSEQARLTASNAATNDQFGNSVSISGDNVVIGAWQEASNATLINGDQTNNSDSFAGAAYVFVRSGTAWSQQAYLKASNTDPGDFFGVGVGISGDTAVVGAYFEASSTSGINGNGFSNTAARAGAAYVYAGIVASAANYTITTSSSPAAGGSTSGGATVAPGTSVTVVATPNTGYNFVNWTEGGSPVSASASYNFNASASRTLVANFAPTSNVDARLASLLPSVGLLSPTFGSGTLNYTASVPKSALYYTVTPSVVQPAATVKVSAASYNGGIPTSIASGSASGHIPLTIGSNNVITTTVTAPDGVTTQTYTLTITRVNTPPVMIDMTGSGKPNLLFQNTATGQVYAWFLDGTGASIDFNTGSGLLSKGYLYGGTLVGWQLAGAGDVNGDGIPDLIFQNAATGQLVAWLLDGTGASIDLGTGSGVKATGYLYGGSLVGWRLVGLADVNGDGIPDLVFQHIISGQVTAWFLDGTGATIDFNTGSGIKSTGVLYGGSLVGWPMAGIADVNGDGIPDLVFQNSSTGQIYAFFLDGTGAPMNFGTGSGFKGTGYLYGGGIGGFRLASITDVTGDGIPDLLFQNIATGQLYAWYLDGTGASINFGTGSGVLGYGYIYGGSLPGWLLR